MTEPRTAAVADALSLDTTLELLSDRRRRIALEILDEHRRRLTINDLTKEIAVRERDEEITDVPPGALTDIHHSLVHVHAPKLADADVVTYDDRRQTVTPGAQFGRVQASLRALADVDSTSHGPNAT